MPIWEILVALAISALAADSPTVIDRLARAALAAMRWWKKHKRG